METIKTYEDIIKTNYIPQDKFDSLLKRTDVIIKEHNLQKENIDITDTPISPFLLLEDNQEIIMSDEVTKEYHNYIKLINDPSTAFEYSLLLLGRLKEYDGNRFYVLDKIIDCAKKQDKSSRMTNYDLSKLEQEMKKAMAEGYNFISFCHTHPKIDEPEIKTTIASYLTEEEKEKYQVRNPGLNLSLQDLINYDSLYQYIKNPNIKTAETVMMYNGDVAIVTKENNELKVYSNIYESREFNNVSVITRRQSQLKK